ncbi:hypothetical protein [Melissococcus plutonius]|uniref:hypothetical protein n=1 Tax=Melissococcus plutonius TaxID=33970 RepID=UPI001E3F1E60|nr:hypothetical protein [Melissococcus plutonius]
MNKLANHPLKKSIPFSIIGFVTFLFILPKWLSKSMIIGSDAMIHFNRFYETMMQIKQGNFSYYLSLYDFQQSGRIVNALYGPFMAYFQGLLALMGGSWFHYQLLSNSVLYFIAGSMMFLFLKKAIQSNRLALWGALIYMSTYSIQYWTIRQGFSSWGAAFFPLCLLPMLTLVNQKKIPVIPLSLAVALMFQIHLFSAGLLVACYLPVIFYLFIHSSEKGRFFWDSLCSLFLFICLTLNIWLSLFSIYGQNSIATVYTNTKMSESTINQHSFYWLISPIIISVILVLQFVLSLKYWKKMNLLSKFAFLLLLVFLLLSSSLVPWDDLIRKKFWLAELTQFPFRFFIPATNLGIYLFAYSLKESFIQMKNLKKIGNLIIILSVLQTVLLIHSTSLRWHQTNQSIARRGSTFIKKQEIIKTKSSFFSTKMDQSLRAVQKPTPDYLPIYQKKNRNMYHVYRDTIIHASNRFTKKVVGNQLVVTWQSTSTKKVSVPIIKYAATQLTFNGKQLKSTDFTLGAIGTPIINQKKGTNQLMIRYQSPSYFTLCLLITIGSWVCLLIVFIVCNHGKIRK